MQLGLPSAFGDLGFAFFPVRKRGRKRGKKRDKKRDKRRDKKRVV
jgi:hypothetical protein